MTLLFFEVPRVSQTVRKQVWKLNQGNGGYLKSLKHDVGRGLRSGCTCWQGRVKYALQCSSANYLVHTLGWATTQLCKDSYSKPCISGSYHSPTRIVVGLLRLKCCLIYHKTIWFIRWFQCTTFRKHSNSNTVDGSEILHNHLGWCTKPLQIMEFVLPSTQLVSLRDFFHSSTVIAIV